MKIVAILLALIVPPAMYFPTLGAQRRREIAKADSEINELDKRIEQAHAAKRKIDQFHDEVARLDEEIVKLWTILPAVLNMDDVRTLTESRAAAHAVTVSKFDVRGNSVHAEVVGDPAGLTDFFREIQNAPRIIDVSYVTLRKDAAGWRTDFVMTAYALAD